METIEDLLYLAVRELAYVQEVENCNSGLCATSAGKDLVERGMKALGVTSLEEETLPAQKQLHTEVTEREKS